MATIKEVRKALEVLKEAKIKDIAVLKDSVLTDTLYYLYYANFDIIEEFLDEHEEKMRIDFETEDGQILSHAVLNNGSRLFTQTEWQQDCDYRHKKFMENRLDTDLTN